MGMYNTLSFNIKCPKCNNHHEIEADFRFGFMNLYEYKIGDKLVVCVI
jgi:hypothetical protein